MQQFKDFFDSLDADKLGMKWPNRAIFFCGGEIGRTSSGFHKSMRSYMMERRLKPSKTFSYVLAESANNIFLETRYEDLISFEEDIAEISTVVLVISESAGALAELGAFASNNRIWERLRVIVPEKFHSQNSFVRLGPIQKIENKNGKWVAAFPWSARKDGTVIKSQIHEFESDLNSFIKENIDDIDDELSFIDKKEFRKFIIIYWILHVYSALKLEQIFDLYDLIIPNSNIEELKNRLFCMIVVEWIVRKKYSNSYYYYNLKDMDPLAYQFKRDAILRDAARWKILLKKEIGKIGAYKLPRGIKRALEARQS